jgi:hypothetical protein
MVLGGAASWVTLTVCPATVNLPERALAVVFAATEYRTLPSPVPFAPAVIVIHATVLVAVHSQVDAEASTRISRLSPSCRISWVVGDTTNVHRGVAAAPWLTVTVRPATVSTPDLGEVSVLAATA